MRRLSKPLGIAVVVVTLVVSAFLAGGLLAPHGASAKQSGAMVVSKTLSLPNGATCATPDTYVGPFGAPYCLIDSIAEPSQPASLSVLVQYGSEPFADASAIAGASTTASWSNGTLSLLLALDSNIFPPGTTVIYSATVP